MVIVTAWWGLGYAALMVSMVAYGWYLLRRDRAIGLAGLILALMSTLILWIALISRATMGHGWPLVSSADAAGGIALITLLLYAGWKLYTPELKTGFTVTAIALILLSYELGQHSPPLLAQPLPSTGVLVGTALKLLGGSLLAMAAAISVTPLIGSWQVSRSGRRVVGLERAHAERLRAPGRAPENAHAAGVPHQGAEQSARDLQRASETLVRGALLCLAFSLAIDTWWLQKVGLGNANDAQQAGIALAWMVYFGALRLRAHRRWRGWPWAAILSIGFVCVLPILINAPWLEKTLPI